MRGLPQHTWARPTRAMRPCSPRWTRRCSTPLRATGVSRPLAAGVLTAFRPLPTLHLFGGVSGMSNMSLSLNDAQRHEPNASMTNSIRRPLGQTIDRGGGFGQHRLPMWLYFGRMLLLQALAGGVLAWRRTWPWIVVAALLAWLSMVDRAPVDPFVWRHQLPLFNAVSRPGKYFAPPMLLCVVPMSSACGDRRRRPTPTGRRRRSRCPMAPRASSRCSRTSCRSGAPARRNRWRT